MGISAVDAPGSKGLMGHMSAFSDSGLDFLLGTAKVGDLARLRFGPFRAFSANSPELIHDVLVTNASSYHKSTGTKANLYPLLGNGLFLNEGAPWKKQRKLVSPAFQHKRVGAYAEIMVNYAEALAERWQDGDALAFDEEMVELTMRIVTKTLFDADVTAEAAELGHAVDQALKMVDQRFQKLIQLPMWLPTAQNRTYSAAIKRLEVQMYQFINNRRAEGTPDKGDALSMLMLSKDDTDGTVMSDRQIRDEILTLFGAGHETTSRTLAWTFYALSQYPEIEARLHAELDSVLEGRSPAVEDFANLPYLDKLVKESMRMYPPAWATTRSVIEPVKLGAEQLRKNDVVIVNIYGVHHDPRFYPDPWTFDPERFTPENEKALPKGAYIPFGSGPRVCIGNAFAMMEAKLIIAVLAQRFSLSLKPGHIVQPEDVFTLRPKYGLQMVAHARAAQPVMA
jgi:cytochrome P450